MLIEVTPHHDVVLMCDLHPGKVLLWAHQETDKQRFMLRPLRDAAEPVWQLPDKQDDTGKEWVIRQPVRLYLGDKQSADPILGIGLETGFVCLVALKTFAGDHATRAWGTPVLTLRIPV